MAVRVNEDDLRHWLAWARNFEEIVEYASVAPRGRRWRIRVRPGVTSDGRPLTSGLMGHRPETVVPEEFVLTSREAMAFAFGCAVGGSSRERSSWTQEDWEAQAERRRGDVDAAVAAAGARNEARERAREGGGRRVIGGGG